jgi:hypothetical protein
MALRLEVCSGAIKISCVRRRTDGPPSAHAIGVLLVIDRRRGRHHRHRRRYSSSSSSPSSRLVVVTVVAVAVVRRHGRRGRVICDRHGRLRFVVICGRHGRRCLVVVIVGTIRRLGRHVSSANLSAKLNTNFV